MAATHSKASQTPTLKIGDEAPDFTLDVAKGTFGDEKQITLNDFRSKKNVLLAFYPKAFSGTCGAQMPAYEADLERFNSYDTQVVGISVDSTLSNAAWAERVLGGIHYPLASDYYPHGAIAEKYGVLMPYGFAERALFIIDKQGIIRFIDVHETGHQPDNEEVFEVLRELA